MNRRELFAGAGAAALSAAVPVVPTFGGGAGGGKTAGQAARRTWEVYGEDAIGNTQIWVVSWGTGAVEQVEGEVLGGQLWFRRPPHI
jgi:hypothetical protein